MRWYIALAYFFLRLIGRLPLPALHGIGAAIGWLLWIAPNPLRRKAAQTLSYVITYFDAESRQSLLKSTLIETGKSALELCRIWSGDARTALDLVREVRGGELFEQALASGKGLIVAAPHLGCWELLTFWVCKRTPAGRWGTLDEIGPPAVFLASDEASFVNGHILTVDGAFTSSM